MAKLNHKIFKSSDKTWIDEQGTEIPVNRITPTEKLTERKAAALLKKALMINKHLTAFKELLQVECEAIAEAVLADLKSNKKRKGNFTFFTFNRSVKIEVNVSERIEFDDLTIQAAKEKLDTFLDTKVQGDEMVKQLVMDAFEKSRGKMDVKKVLQLLKHKDRINDPLFSEALNLISKAIRKPESKLYFRIWAKDNQGEYQNIDLNLSSI